MTVRASTGATLLNGTTVRSTRLPSNHRAIIRVEGGSTTRYSGVTRYGNSSRATSATISHRAQRNAVLRGEPELVIGPELSTIHPMSRTAAKTETASDASF